VLLLCGLALYFCHQFLSATSSVNHSTGVIGEIRTTRSLLEKLEKTAPGQHPSVSISAILDQFDRATQLTRDNPLQQQNAQDFRRLVSQVAGHDNPAADFPTLDAAHALLGNMQAEEYRLLTARTRNLADVSRSAAIAVSALCLALLVVGMVVALAARREFRLRETAEQTLQTEKQELTRYSHELALVSTGCELIQAAQDEAQLNSAVGQILGEMLPEASGYFALVSPSKDLVEVCESWGGGQVPEAFHPSDCVALQLGRKIHRNESLVHIPCKHVNPCSDCICMPLRSVTAKAIEHVRWTLVT